MKIRVAVADDHQIVLSGIEKLLAGHENIELIHTASNGNELLKNMKARQPDVLLLDIQMPGMSGNELARIITTDFPAVNVLALTNMDQAFHVRTMFRNGAKGYLLKSADRSILTEAIRTVYQGTKYIDASLKDELLFEALDERKTGKNATLTKREQQVLELIAQGKTSPEIAGELNLSTSTIENHRLNLFFKLGVKNMIALLNKARQLGLIA